MKKVLSLVLSTMMLVSLFAVNASAMISTSYTEIVGATEDTVFVAQDFSDAENIEFSAGTYGSATVENGCVTLHSPTSSVAHVSCATPVATDATKWTIEFDVKRNSDFADTSYFGVFFVCNKSAYEGDAEKIANYIEDYGIYIPLMKNEKDVWYTYRVSFDEDAVVAQVPNVTSNIPNTLAKYIVTKAEYKKAGDTTWTKINDEMSWNAVQNQARALVMDQGKSVFAYKGYPIEVDGQKIYTSNEMSFAFMQPHPGGGFGATEEEIAAASFSLDNIKAYIPGDPGVEVVKNYPLANGTIHLSSAKANVPDASKYNPTSVISVNNNYTIPTAALATGVTRFYTVTFDAANTVQGLPLMIHIGGKTAHHGFGICPTDIIGTDRYSYKVVVKETAGEAYLQSTVYRKPYGSDAPYELVPMTAKYAYTEGDQIWGYGSRSNANDTIRFMYDSNYNPANYPDADLYATVWDVTNLQVTSGAVVVGFADAADGTISVDADFVAATGDAAVALAVYDSENRMVDVDFVKVAGGSGELDLSANYADGNAAVLLIWDGVKDNAPLVQPIDVVSALAE